MELGGQQLWRAAADARCAASFALAAVLRAATFHATALHATALRATTLRTTGVRPAVAAIRTPRVVNTALLIAIVASTLIVIDPTAILAPAPESQRLHAAHPLDGSRTRSSSVRRDSQGHAPPQPQHRNVTGSVCQRRRRRWPHYLEGSIVAILAGRCAPRERQARVPTPRADERAASRKRCRRASAERSTASDVAGRSARVAGCTAQSIIVRRSSPRAARSAAEQQRAQGCPARAQRSAQLDAHAEAEAPVHGPARKYGARSQAGTACVWLHATQAFREALLESGVVGWRW